MYCLFVNTVRRAQLADIIQKRMGVETIVPKILRRKWIKGKALDTIQDYLPGYLFLYAERPIEVFTPLFRLEDVYRLLGDPDNGYQLMGTDFGFAKMLRDCGGTIGVLKTYREGDRVKLVENALGGAMGEIIKLDRRGRALVRFSFGGATMQSWVAIEQIEDDGQTAET